MDTLIAAFLAGVFLTAAIARLFHRKQQKDWQAEYRRLMSGIKNAWIDLDKPSIPTSFIANDLRKLFHNEPTWPRG